MRRALGDRNERAFGKAGIELTRTEMPGLGICDHLVPLRHPANRTRHGEDRRKHRRRQSQVTEDYARIEINVGIELALYEIVVGKNNLLQLHRQLEERIVVHPQSVEHLVAATAQYLGPRVVALVNAVAETIRRNGLFLSLARRTISGMRSTEPISARFAAHLGWRRRAAVPIERQSPLRRRHRGLPASSRRAASTRGDLTSPASASTDRRRECRERDW